MRVYEVAKKLNLSSGKLMKILADLGIKAKSNLSGLTAEEIKKVREFVLEKKPSPPEEKLVPRAPVVTFLGHVDHGKTSLLDAIRKTTVAQREVGGITQRIGASEVEFQGQRIVFIDTPGHEAFTAMRAHGAQITDIAVLVIAADDGVMPQTVEAINHARAAKVPIIVAINKIDKKEANVERVKKQLIRYDLMPEEWGGETICVEVSALTRQGLDELLEMILLEAEILELKANPDADLRAVVIEGEMDRQKGPLSTLLVQQGILRVGDVLVGGSIYGKVRALINWKGKNLKEAGVSTPVRVLGLSEVGRPGTVFKKVANEREARQLAEKFKEEERERSLRKKNLLTLESLFQQTEENKKRTLNIVLKAEAQGSLKAVFDVLKKLENDEVELNIIHEGVGDVSRSDILLASASKAMVLGFNVGVSPTNRALAKSENVNIREHRIIYELIDDVEKILKGLIEPKYEEITIGKAEVRNIFKIPRVGTVAGCYIVEGKVLRGSRVRVLRDGKTVGEGTIKSLRRFDQDVRELSSGLECGINIEGFKEIRKGDLIEVYERRRIGDR
ncbi:translation initiation factor IF-2 [Candidatus Aerophobetes bacterium]|uniref:Translation initiation factor IF-2 n=1 Tax=Aerophobetes bacterium TaxID=2030807 RepID=A0A497E5C9_UNCAE|nr:MAG: translation initiation factor IF-2 [Candidatus Aerophobetes bacterium]